MALGPTRHGRRHDGQPPPRLHLGRAGGRAKGAAQRAREQVRDLRAKHRETVIGRHAGSDASSSPPPSQHQRARCCRRRAYTPGRPTAAPASSACDTVPAAPQQGSQQPPCPAADGPHASTAASQCGDVRPHKLVSGRRSHMAHTRRRAAANLAQPRPAVMAHQHLASLRQLTQLPCHLERRPTEHAVLGEGVQPGECEVQGGACSTAVRS